MKVFTGAEPLWPNVAVMGAHQRVKRWLYR